MRINFSFKNFLWSLFFFNLIKYMLGKIFYFFLIIIDYFLVYINYNESLLSKFNPDSPTDILVLEKLFNIQDFLDTMDYPTLVMLHNHLEIYYNQDGYRALVIGGLFICINMIVCNMRPTDDINLYTGKHFRSWNEVYLQEGIFMSLVGSIFLCSMYYICKSFYIDVLFLDYYMIWSFLLYITPEDYLWLTDLMNSNKSEEDILSEFKIFMNDKIKK